MAGGSQRPQVGGRAYGTHKRDALDRHLGVGELASRALGVPTATKVWNAGSSPLANSKAWPAGPPMFSRVIRSRTEGRKSLAGALTQRI